MHVYNYIDRAVIIHYKYIIILSMRAGLNITGQIIPPQHIPDVQRSNISSGITATVQVDTSSTLSNGAVYRTHAPACVP